MPLPLPLAGWLFIYVGKFLIPPPMVTTMIESMTQNQIARTAFNRVSSETGNPMGAQTLRTCPYCKNQHTEVEVDQLFRAKIKEYWLTDDFTIRSCFCGAVWSDGNVGKRQSFGEENDC